MHNADAPVTLGSGCLSTHIKSLCAVPNHSPCKQQNESLQQTFFGINRSEDVIGCFFFSLHNPSCNKSFKLYFFRIYGIFKNLNLFIIEAQLIYNVVLILVYSKVIQLYTHNTHIYMYICILFHYGLLQDIEYSSLCYTVGPCCLLILCIIVCTCQSQTPNLSLSSLFPLVTISLLSISVSLFLIYK